ncbi:CCR4-NOT transcription complex subunit 10 [Anopheles marshallii]|uniref:CCR4-NOT transcription complex subunit 10 n=1 Tax=Anopheles marshallii TaxID=1521116 RepID=UPI00237B9921|nr:CCR4-NOT transcription complex subunit 10 [Anopheles marshallii]
MADANPAKKPTLSDQERDLEQQAFIEFQKADYHACHQTLQKLLKTQDCNPKVLHNKAVVEFYNSDLRRYDQFRSAMIQLTGLVGEIRAVDVKDRESCAAYVNQAIVLYHFKQPLAALKIMLAVMAHFDRLDDYLLRRAGIFTVHLLLDTNQPKKANRLLGMLQNRLGIQVYAILSDSDEDEPLIDNESRKDISELQFEEFRKEFRLILIRSNLLNGKKNMSIPLEDTSEYSILKGHQYFLGNDYQMAAKELSKQFTNEPVSVNKHGEDQNTILANNMGVIHFSVKHYALAARFFQQALLFDKSATEDTSTEKVEGSPLYCVGATKRPEILYNHGLALLHLQRPKEAFECMLIVLNSNHNNPRLWLRLAECCIMVHRQEKQTQNTNICHGTVGSGVHRKYILNPLPKTAVVDGDQSLAIPATTLEFGSLCLRNAVTLLEFHEPELIRQSESSDKTVAWDKVYEGVPCNPSLPMKLVSFNKLKCAVLAAYSYVLNTLGEYSLALKYAKQMLTMKDLPQSYLLLSHMYAAEALIMMNRPLEAITYLEPKFITELAGDDFGMRASPHWNINSADAARSVMYYNRAVVSFLIGDYEQAKIAMGNCNHPLVMPYLKMLNVYQELLLGNYDKVQLLIRYDTPHLI